MKTVYYVRIRAGVRAETLVHDLTVAASSTPYAVKLAMESARHKLPRGWKRLWVEVGRYGIN